MQNRYYPSEIFLFHKPKGVIVTRRDERNRKTVYDVLPSWVSLDRWIPVGRLDRDTRGLLLFTRRGDWINLLTMPHSCLKKYEVWVRGHVEDEHLKRIVAGIEARGEILKAARAERTGIRGARSRLILFLDEGKNRHIRRLMAMMRDPVTGRPFKVMDLKRVAFGPIDLDVPSGQWKFLTPLQAAALTDIRAMPQQRNARSAEGSSSPLRHRRGGKRPSSCNN